jgi:hypothetical protein
VYSYSCGCTGLQCDFRVFSYTVFVYGSGGTHIPFLFRVRSHGRNDFRPAADEVRRQQTIGKLPSGRRSSVLAELIDVMPTMIDAMGLMGRCGDVH